MNLCKVIGVVVSTIKDSKLNGYKLLLCMELEPEIKPNGIAFVAVDNIGAGKGDIVLVIKGSPAEHVVNAPVDAAIVAIVDTIEK